MKKKIIARLIIIGTLLALAWFVRHRQEQQALRHTAETKEQRQDKKEAQKENRAVKVIKSAPLPSGSVPEYVREVLHYVRAYGEAPGGYVGGREFQNREKKLPQKAPDGKKIRYSEWDVHPKVQGQNRGAERLVTGSDHSAWYTRDHYKNFVQVE